MSVSTSPSERAATAPFDARGGGRGAAVPLARADGRVALGFELRAGATRLVHRDQRAPLRVFAPHDRALGASGATLVNTAGGLAGGDRLAQSVDVGAGAAAVVTAQAAEKVYRSTGPATHVDTTLSLAEGGWLEWLPQETILFDRAHLRRSTTAHLHAGARLLAGEMLVLGRTASGERVADATLLERWRLHRDDRLVWADGLSLRPPNAEVIDAPAGFGGDVAIATVVYLAPDAERWLETARALLADVPARAGVSRIGSLLLVRMLASTGARLRAAVAAFWSGFRAEVAGLPAVLPRAWSL